MTQERQIKSFILNLSKAKLDKSAFNQFGSNNKHNAIRQQNLNLYLSQMLKLKPKVLLLGEAPGYQGMRMTGIPFTSEHLMLEGINELDMLGSHRGYRKTDEFQKVSKEPTGTIVWSTLASHNFLPLLWGTFPFHPHKIDNPLSNRPPTAAEVSLGTQFFSELADIFRIQKIYAVGNVAYATLTGIGVRTTKIRHPSHGGKPEFVAGIRRIMSA